MRQRNDRNFTTASDVEQSCIPETMQPHLRSLSSSRKPFVSMHAQWRSGDSEATLADRDSGLGTCSIARYCSDSVLLQSLTRRMLQASLCSLYNVLSPKLSNNSASEMIRNSFATSCGLVIYVILFLCFSCLILNFCIYLYICISLFYQRR